MIERRKGALIYFKKVSRNKKRQGRNSNNWILFLIRQ